MAKRITARDRTSVRTSISVDDFTEEDFVTILSELGHGFKRMRRIVDAQRARRHVTRDVMKPRPNGRKLLRLVDEGSRFPVVRNRGAPRQSARW